MATYYSSPNNQREYLPNSYPDMMIYMGSESYSENAALASNSHQNCIEIQPDSASHHQQDILSNLGGPHDFVEWREAPPSIVHGGGQGLSLSLGTQIPSSAQFRTHSNVGPGPGGFMSFSSPSLAEQDYGMSSNVAIARAVPSSKYLKAAQQLLDEVVNVRKALSRQNEREKSPKGGKDEGGSKSESTPGTDGDSSANNSQPELSHAERQDIQNKLTKLLSMLDEVDRRYKQYYHQMQIVVSSFDTIVGGGSAKPYTALALQTISRHFRCLRDAITGQIKAMRKSLGEEDASGSAKGGGGGGAGISRLRYVDQQLRQQRALQQLGMMQQHAWRPQRGLPETSVSILRAWLFEHFLHPYPKDSDKIMLARQTGLTRSQVSNWFINARVRLWKPMVEEMYKEETGEAAEADSNSSSEIAAARKGSDAAAVAASGASEETSEDFQHQHQQSASPTGTARFMDPKPDPVPPPDVEMSGGGGGEGRGGSVVGPADYGGGLVMMKQHHNQQQQQRRRDDCGSLYPELNFHSHPDMSAAAAAYRHMSEMGRFGGGGGGGVSLTLGLQHPAPPRGGARGMAMPGGPHHFVAYNDGAAAEEDSSAGPDGADFEQPPRFGLHDFVV